MLRWLSNWETSLGVSTNSARYWELTGTKQEYGQTADAPETGVHEPFKIHASATTCGC